MFNHTKYIIVEEEMGAECAIVFSYLLKHADVANSRAVVKVISAGFVSFSIDWEGTGDAQRPVLKAECYGKSESLKIGSRPGMDDAIIEKYILQK
jgi:hypothetical protein